MARRHETISEIAPPRDELIRRRWINSRVVESVREADVILLRCGQVVGVELLPTHGQARWQARRLVDLMVDLRLHARWELVQHVEKTPGGYKWAVEYVGRSAA